VYIQVRNSEGTESFIKEVELESGIASGEIVAFRRSNGWITVPFDSHRGDGNGDASDYCGQERRRTVLSKKRKIPETE
jgi:hypothetical protein